jgi:hypothetical protein
MNHVEHFMIHHEAIGLHGMALVVRLTERVPVDGQLNLGNTVSIL